MEKKEDVLSQFNDVLLKLANIGDLDEIGIIKKEAMKATMEYCNATYEKVNSIINGTRFEYEKSDLPIVIFFHESLRKILETRQRHSLL